MRHFQPVAIAILVVSIALHLVAAQATPASPTPQVAPASPLAVGNVSGVVPVGFNQLIPTNLEEALGDIYNGTGDLSHLGVVPDWFYDWRLWALVGTGVLVGGLLFAIFTNLVCQRCGRCDSCAC